MLKPTRTYLCACPWHKRTQTKRLLQLPHLRRTCWSFPGVEYRARAVRLSEQGTSPRPVCREYLPNQRYHWCPRAITRVVRTDRHSRDRFRYGTRGAPNGTFLNGKADSRASAGRTGGWRSGSVGNQHRLHKLVRLNATDENNFSARDVRADLSCDTLTGLYNRAYLLNQVGVLAERSGCTWESAWPC